MIGERRAASLCATAARGFAMVSAVGILIGCPRPDAPVPGTTDAISADSATLAAAIAAQTPSAKVRARPSTADPVPERVARFVGPRLDTGQVMRSASMMWDTAGGVSVVSVRHEREDGRWPFGTALVLMRADSVLRWLGDFRGDYAPYKLDWFDVNGDGRRDVYAAVGEEDIFNTWVLVDPDGRGDFVEVLYNDLSYLGVVDLDGDGRPEFVGPAFNIRPGFGDDGPCDGVSTPVPPPQLAALAHQALGMYPGVNFDYGMGAEMAAGSAVKLGEPVRIWSVQGRRAIDVTTRFKDQLRERRAFAASTAADAPPPCQRQLDSVVAYFDSVLATR